MHGIGTTWLHDGSANNSLQLTRCTRARVCVRLYVCVCVCPALDGVIEKVRCMQGRHVFSASQRRAREQELNEQKRNLSDLRANVF